MKTRRSSILRRAKAKGPSISRTVFFVSTSWRFTVDKFPAPSGVRTCARCMRCRAEPPTSKCPQSGEKPRTQASRTKMAPPPQLYRPQHASLASASATCFSWLQGKPNIFPAIHSTTLQDRPELSAANIYSKCMNSQSTPLAAHYCILSLQRFQAEYLLTQNGRPNAQNLTPNT